MITTGADLNAGDVNGDTPLHMAVKAGNVAKISALLEKTVLINKQNVCMNVPAQR